MVFSFTGTYKVTRIKLWEAGGPTTVTLVNALELLAQGVETVHPDESSSCWKGGCTRRVLYLSVGRVGPILRMHSSL
jgi:hypothetical protein